MGGVRWGWKASAPSLHSSGLLTPPPPLPPPPPQVSSATRIEVVTEGILLRRLQHDPELAGVGAVSAARGLQG